MRGRTILWTSSRFVAGLGLASGVLSCDAAPSPGASVNLTVRDSAGVRIVTHTLADLNAADARAPGDTTPTLRIGSIDGPPGTTFDGVRALVESPSGTIAVADNNGTVVRFYSSDGTYLGAQGTEGDGPGEYRLITGMSYLAGDTLAVYDVGSARLSLIAPDRQYVHSMALPIPANRLGFVNRIYDVGTSAAVMLYQERPDPRRLLDPERNMEPRIEQDTLSLLWLRVTDTGVVVDTLGRVPGISVYVLPRPGGESRTSIRFGAAPFLSSSSTSGFIVSHGSQFEVRRYRPDGTLDQIIRIAATPRPVTREDQEASGPQNERTAFADTHPLIMNTAVDGDGNIWVAPEESVAAGRGWIVFSAEGEIRGWAPYLSPHGSPLYVGAGYLYARTTDAVDAMYISKYRLEGP